MALRRLASRGRARSRCGAQLCCGVGRLATVARAPPRVFPARGRKVRVGRSLALRSHLARAPLALRVVDARACSLGSRPRGLSRSARLRAVVVARVLVHCF
ncbi:hypothetical protein CesoFtcFv8_021473 [Champsocephalus esox]|uniref:Uncharacterized protein n=1 Tax=Champsocephalus esox TaxID=159716 RepID=A0AAN8GL10_9TELE|nr:hypothetical protein CesoFtcFv8_021473 [Champsocephalus esox]